MKTVLKELAGLLIAASYFIALMLVLMGVAEPLIEELFK